jgi:hypothetical protein
MSFLRLAWGACLPAGSQVRMPSAEYQRIVRDLAAIGENGGWRGLIGWAGVVCA